MLDGSGFIAVKELNVTTNDWGSIYKEMGAKPVVNATGSVTLLVVQLQSQK
jgi:hypothetical protein